MSDSAVVLGGVRTRVVDEGVGPVVVLVHATPFDLDYWSGLALALRRYGGRLQFPPWWQAMWWSGQTACA